MVIRIIILFSPLCVWANSFSSFCNDPISFICHGRREDPRIVELKTQSKAFARAEVKRRFGVDVESHIDVQQSYKKSKPEPAVLEYAKLVEQKLRESFNYVPLLHSVERKAKNVMETVVRESTFFTEEEKNAALAALQDYRLLTPADYLREKPEDFLRNCTPSTFSRWHALAYSSSKEIAFCTVVLLKMLGRGEDIIMRTLMHEIGHLIDRNLNLNNEAYDNNYMSCLEKNYSKNPVSGISLSNDGLPFKNFMIEIIANYWASEGTAVYLRGLPMAQRDIIKTIWDQPCGYLGSPRHPMGWFAIEVVVRRNPNVANAMGCSQPYQNTPYCTLSGESTLPPGHHVGEVVHAMPDLSSIVNETASKYPDALSRAGKSNDDRGWEFTDRVIQKLHSIDPRFGHRERDLSWQNPNVLTPIISFDTFIYAEGAHTPEEHTNTNGPIQVVDFILGAKGQNPGPRWGPVEWANDPGAYSRWVFPRPGAPIYDDDAKTCPDNKHWEKVDDKCLPSCGHAKNLYCKENDCDELKLSRRCDGDVVANLESYNSRACCMLEKTTLNDENTGTCGTIIANTCTGGDFHPHPHDTATLHRWTCRNRPHDGEKRCEKQRSEDNNNPQLGRCSETPNHCDGGELYTLTSDEDLPRLKERYRLNPNLQSDWIVDGQKLWVCRNTQTHYDDSANGGWGHTGEIFCPADLAYGQE